MNLNTKIMLLNFTALLLTCAPLEAMELRSTKKRTRLQSGQEGEVKSDPQPLKKADLKPEAEAKPDEVVVTIREASTAGTIPRDAIVSGLDREVEHAPIPAWVAKITQQALERKFQEDWQDTLEQSRRDAAATSSWLFRDVCPLTFGPKTLKETMEANTREAIRLLEECYANNSKPNAKVNLQVHDLLFVVPEIEKGGLRKAIHRVASTTTWLLGRPSHLQQAIQKNDLVAVFKYSITDSEAFYAEVNAQGIEDMDELGATPTMEHLVQALFVSLESFYAKK